jgi:6-phosphogluconolactonase (cycloisomerase 2 family)
MTDAGPNDMALSMNSKFLYVFDSGAHEIQGFRVQSDGELIFLQTVSGIPAGADGLAAN